jgi:hypothetical protein
MQQQMEEEQRHQKEMKKRQQMEEQQRQAMKQQQLRQQQEEEEEDDRHIEMEPTGYERGEPGGALVQEARKLMQEDEDEAPREVENAGPKIKMNRIGRKPKKVEEKPGASKPGPPGTKEAKEASWKPAGEKSISGGFSEQDIEFMKKAIQVLCQSTNPLGKSIDFVTDDIDSMNKEFEHWKRESSSCQQ